MVSNKKVSVPALLIGSLVGGVIGTSLGFLFAPKPGKELRKEINYGSQKATRKASEWKDTVQEKSDKLSNKAIAKKSELKAKKRFNEPDNKKFSVPSFIMGSCVGGILGASVGLIVAPKTGSKLREDITVGSKKALEQAEEWKETVQDSDTDFLDKVKTTGTDLKNKSADLTKQALIKTFEWKDTIQEQDAEILDRVVANGTVLINKCVAVIKKVIDTSNKFNKIVENITEFSLDATDRTKELYEDVSKQAKSLKDEVVETSTEVKEEVVDQAKVVAKDAKSVSEDIKKDHVNEDTNDLNIDAEDIKTNLKNK